MTLNLGVRLALEAEGFTETQITAITNALPAAARLLAAYERLEPEWAKALPDIATVVPVLRMIINNIQEKTS